MSGLRDKFAALTPTQDLLMEVLAARYRLGETLWTFDTRHERALGQLAEKGLVILMHGIVAKTLRASMTPQGREYALDDNYDPPLLSARRREYNALVTHDVGTGETTIAILHERGFLL